MDNIDVELQALLGDDSSLETTSNGASAENSEGTDNSPAEQPAELSPREQKRAKELADRVAELESQLAAKNSQPEKNWKDEIEDEGTRALVSKIIEEAEQRAEQKFSPLLTDYKKTQFEQTFSQYAEKVPVLEKFKGELQKEFNLNPNMDIKSRLSEIVLDTMVNKIKPIESGAPTAPRADGDVDLNKASKDDLYALLESKRK